MYVCLCQAVRDSDVQAALKEGCRSLDALADHLGVGAGCGGCREHVQTLIDAHAPQRALPIVHSAGAGD